MYIFLKHRRIRYNLNMIKFKQRPFKFTEKKTTVNSMHTKKT